MTDQPEGPTEPTPAEPTPAEPTPAAPPAAPVEPTASPAPAAPTTPPAATPPPAAPPAATPPPAAPPTYAAPPPSAAPPQYAAPQYAAPPPQYAAPAQPGYPPPAQNPYGGYTQAPAYAAGAGPASPGSLAFVEQNFGKVADFGQRALAYLVDFAVTLIGLVPMVLGIILLIAGVPTTTTYDDYGNVDMTGGNGALAAVGGILIVVGILLSIGISLWNRVFKMGRTGQSVGKKVMGLYLLDDKTGQPIGAGMCFLRELLQGLVNQVVYLGWLWMLWDTDRQTLGDKAVHSTVVVIPKA